MAIYLCLPADDGEGARLRLSSVLEAEQREVESDRCPQLTADHLCMRKMELGKILFHRTKGQSRSGGQKDNKSRGCCKTQRNEITLSIRACGHVDFHAYFSI